jgi:hypothetical protein
MLKEMRLASQVSKISLNLPATQKLSVSSLSDVLSFSNPLLKIHLKGNKFYFCVFKVFFIIESTINTEL